MMQRLATIALSLLVVVSAEAQTDLPFDVEPITSFDEPWAMAFLPDGRMLVTEKKGSVFIVTADGKKAGPLRWGRMSTMVARGGLVILPCTRSSPPTILFT